MRLAVLLLLLIMLGCAEAGTDGMLDPDEDAAPAADASEDAAQTDVDAELDTSPDAGPPIEAVINELVADEAGNDVHEFIEVLGPASTDLGLTLVGIEGDGAGAGTIDNVFTVGMTDGAGLWQTGPLTGVLENGTLTVLLVEGFMGAGVGTDLDAANDGILDSTPWTRIVDAVAIADGGADQAYGVPVLGPSFDGLVAAHPGGASRIPDGADTELPADWKRNDYDGQGFPAVTGTPITGEAINTPGATNMAVP